MQSVAKNYAVCETYWSPCISKSPFLRSFTKYIILKDYIGHSLMYVTEQVYMFFVALERIFLYNINHLTASNSNIHPRLVAAMKYVRSQMFAECHDIKNKIMDRFVIFRLRIFKPYQIKQKRQSFYNCIK